MRKIFVALLPLFILLLNCEEKSSVTPVGKNPVLFQLSAPDTLYVVSSIPHYISVRAEDPQGANDIVAVTCAIFDSNSTNPIKIDSLADDGTRGDIIREDGVYTSEINADFAQGQPGVYSLVLKAVDFSDNESNTLDHQILIIDGEENIAPAITDVVVPMFIDIKDTFQYVITATVKDPQGLEDIRMVLLKIFSPTSNIPVLMDTLWDDSQHGDFVSGDGIYSQIIDTTFTKKQVGKYSFRFQAYDNAGGESLPVVKIVDVIDSDNSPPYIFNLSAPDTMKLIPNRTVRTVLTINASDPQGLADISVVYFKSIRPDGNYANEGNPLLMMDDGNESVSGDKVAGDGIFSLEVELPYTTPQGEPTQTGDYTFIFEAMDKSDAKSNQITHIVTVIK